jgi:hypothetical protein
LPDRIGPDQDADGWMDGYVIGRRGTFNDPINNNIYMSGFMEIIYVIM